MIWGIDLGVRSVHVAGLDDDTHVAETFTVKPQVVRTLELDALAKSLRALIGPEDDVFVEEPPLAGPRNLSTFAALNQVLGMVLATVGGREANVMQWKRDVCGSGNTDKLGVSRWLQDHHPTYFAQCSGDQNLVDATCIALYGRLVLARVVVLWE